MEAEPRTGSSAFASSPAASQGGRLPARPACLPGVGQKRAERRPPQPVVPEPLPTISMAARVQYSDAGPQSEAPVAGGLGRSAGGVGEKILRVRPSTFALPAVTVKYKYWATLSKGGRSEKSIHSLRFFSGPVIPGRPGRTLGPMPLVEAPGSFFTVSKAVRIVSASFS